LADFILANAIVFLRALGNKKENLVVFNLADFCNSPNRQNKFYAKFSSYTVPNSIKHNLQSQISYVNIKLTLKDA